MDYKLIRFRHANTTKVGMEYNGQVIDLSGYGLPSDITELLANFEAYREAVEQAKQSAVMLMADDIIYLPPIEKPNKIICVGLNYVDHAKETKKDIPGYPVLFARFPSAMSAHNEEICLPKVSKKVDYEAELAVIIKKHAYQIQAVNALEYIAGYSIFNDVTVRDYQGKSSQWLVGKNFEKCGSFGPAILVNYPQFMPDKLAVKTYLNGVLVQNGNTEDMIFSVPQLLEVITEVMALEPGDVIITGTPAGVGYAKNPPVYIKNGDLCTIEIERIGVLSNKFV